MTIVVAGEALIDLVPRGSALQPVPGGSAFNVARGLGRLGVPVAMISTVSTDAFGELLLRELDHDGVNCDLVQRSARPTTLAVLQLRGGHAQYVFYRDGTAALDATAERMPAHVRAVHVSLGAVTLDDAAGRSIATLMTDTKRQTLRCFDPNIRPGAIADLADYRRKIDDIAGNAHIIKLSDDDARLLGLEDDLGQAPQRWTKDGSSVVIITRGAHGATVLAAGETIHVDAPPVEVIDTVGAGDAFSAGLLAGLHKQGVLEQDDVEHSLTIEALTSAAGFAARVAALTCTRVGADPPFLSEL